MVVPWNKILVFHGKIARRKENRKKNLICACSRYNQMPYTDQITEITPYVRISAFPSDLSTMGHLLKPQIINVY